jgi:hypothetical protein
MEHLKIQVISFEVLGNSKTKETVLITSGEMLPEGRDHAVTLQFDWDTMHRMMGRLLGNMIALDREATLDALRSVLDANMEHCS